MTNNSLITANNNSTNNIDNDTNDHHNHQQQNNSYLTNQQVSVNYDHHLHHNQQLHQHQQQPHHQQLQPYSTVIDNDDNDCYDHDDDDVDDNYLNCNDHKISNHSHIQTLSDYSDHFNSNSSSISNNLPESSSTIVENDDHHNEQKEQRQQQEQLNYPQVPPRTLTKRSKQLFVNNNDQNNNKLIHSNASVLLNEKITRLDMAPEPEEQQKQILPPIDNCDHMNVDSHVTNENDDMKRMTKNKKKNSQMTDEWKVRLTQELDLYQRILKQRQLSRQHSSHSTESASVRPRNCKHSSNCYNDDKNHHHQCNGHNNHYHYHHHHNNNSANKTKFTNQKSIKNDNNSMNDSWEETTSNTSDHDNNDNNNNNKTHNIDNQQQKSEQKCIENSNNNQNKVFKRGSKSASSEKSTNYHQNNSQKNPIATKRRSASFNKQRPLTQIITPYERILNSIESDKTWQKEIAFGRRIGFYRFRGDIGNGNFSQVKIAVHSLTKEKVAVKILDKSRLDLKTQKMLSREIKTMETMHHPNLIRIFEVIESYSKHFLVMELAPGGELFQVISSNGRFPETEAKYFFSQIINAIDHMHQHNLIHRDIKAENVFFSDPVTVKVGDFGFSTRISSKDELLSTFCGSPPYAAPELFNDESYRGPYVDYWALGVLLYFIVTGMMPFRAQNIVSLKKLILECQYEIPNHVSVECCQLIAAFLQLDPLKRYTLQQARHTKWLQNQCHQKSLPKYDLKNSYIKLIKHRASIKQMQQQQSFDSTDCENDQKLGNIINESISADNNNNSKNQQYPYPPLSNEEKESFHQLMLLGINEQIIKEHIDKGSHSHIVGTFRILMHRNVRQSLERQRKLSSHDVDNNQNDSPIRRATTMNVAPLDRIWAHYARKRLPEKLKQQKQQYKSDGKSHDAEVKHPVKKPQPEKATNLVANEEKVPKNSKRTERQLTKTSQSSNDSGKINNGRSRLQKMFKTNSLSPSPPLPASKVSMEKKEKSSNDNVSNKRTSESTDNSKEQTQVEEEEEVKVKNRDQLSSVKKNLEHNTTSTSTGDNNTTSRLTRSFRTLKQLLTESNICGNNTPVIQPQTINVGGSNKPHVIHKTTTLQIQARPNPTTHSIWQNNNNYNQKIRGKLWRSQTTPDVSIIDGTMCIGNHTHHHHNNLGKNNHRTLPCYHCDNHHYTFNHHSNKKSFINNNTNNNRCAII